MDLEKLKRTYDGARALNGHDLIEAAEEVGKSPSMINEVLSGRATGQPTIDAIMQYCYDAGLGHTIKKLGLDPESKLKQETA